MKAHTIFASLPVRERIDEVAAFTILEIVEVRMPPRPTQILATNADERARKIRSTGSRRFIRQNARVELPEPGPFAVSHSVREIQPFEVYLHAQVNGFAGRNRGRRAENVGLG